MDQSHYPEIVAATATFEEAPNYCFDIVSQKLFIFQCPIRALNLYKSFVFVSCAMMRNSAPDSTHWTQLSI